MKRFSYAAEFTAEADKQVIERGRGVVEVSNRLGVSEKSLYLWVRQGKEKQGAGRDDAKSAVFDYIEGFYNRVRKNSLSTC